MDLKFRWWKNEISLEKFLLIFVVKNQSKIEDFCVKTWKSFHRIAWKLFTERNGENLGWRWSLKCEMCFHFDTILAPIPFLKVCLFSLWIPLKIESCTQNRFKGSCIWSKKYYFFEVLSFICLFLLYSLCFIKNIKSIWIKKLLCAV